MMIFNNIKNIIFDNACIICKSKKLSKKIPFICNDCLLSFESNIKDTCRICYHPLDDFNKCPSCSKLSEINFDSYSFIQYYTDFFKSIIYKLKIEEDFMINKLFYKLINLKKIIKNNSIITVVPDSFIKRFKKGRSSLYYLLKLFNKNGYKTKYNIYKKSFNKYKSQKDKTVQERLDEIKKLYYLPKKNFNKYSGDVYLIDDIYTTGATINYSAKLLKNAGFKNVHVITFFRAKLDVY
jgi:predicted amidophosphoribosyltransferase